MKKILQISGGMGMGGAETLMMNIYRRLDRERVQLDFLVYTNEEKYYDSEITALGGRLLRVRLYRDFRVIKTLRALVRLMKSGGYSAVHAHVSHNCGLAVLAAKIAGIPVRISHSHTTDFGRSADLSAKIYQRLMSLLINACSTEFCACSRAAADFLFSKRHAKGFTYVPNAVDFEPHYAEYPTQALKNLREELSIPPGVPVVGHVGRFNDAKNQPFVLEVFAELLKTVPDAHLLMVGSGNKEVVEEVEGLVKAAGLTERVHMPGIRADIPQLMKIMDALVFPSRYEGLGIVLLEAQANGLRCLASDRIPPEANVGAGSFESLSLDEAAAKWVERLSALMKKGRLSTDITRKAMDKNGYNLDSVAKQLCRLYGVEA